MTAPPASRRERERNTPNLLVAEKKSAISSAKFLNAGQDCSLFQTKLGFGLIFETGFQKTLVFDQLPSLQSMAQIQRLPDKGLRLPFGWIELSL
jgi:hypothetical protein